MLADIGDFIGLIIFAVIAIIASWLKRKQGESEETETWTPPPPRRPQSTRGQPPPPPVQQPPPKAMTWEEELRRLLEGQLPEREPPPPPIIAQRPAPAPPPLPVPTPRVPEIEEPAFPAAFRPSTVLRESELAYERASHLDTQVEEHFRELMTHPPAQTELPRRSAVRPEIAEALALVRSRRSLRAAVLASVILGPPRALAHEPTLLQ